MYHVSRVLIVLTVFACLTGCWTVGATAAEPEWQDLFNGKDLTGWTNAAGGAPGAGWVIEDGVVTRKSKAGYIWTKKRYGDFVLDLEFKTAGNSGIFFRTDNPKDCVQTGIEIQVNTPASRRTSTQPAPSTAALRRRRSPTKRASGIGSCSPATTTRSRSS